MKQRPLLYIETSVFGFYFDPKPFNTLRRQAAATLFTQIEAGIFRAVTSPLTTKELSRSAEPLRSELLDLVERVEELTLDEDEVERLAGAYLADGVVPADFADDARHAAYATIAGADVLVSMNLRHLANEWAERRLNSVNLREGYVLIGVRTPEEVLRYDE
ncbi:type II toxin-antitoxin system VapC family toxin [candidate division WOR-3 bacterium]|uniref:Type II toxin-antitoxin system VapC family toxin n=1 Tax=candidate division WOR-3 bacterium TaxID=2052148 RepID=A0A937XFJ3_UNCW3|nr:type II toxin-antitoxin system VapC family toxin [candidate division WOR-3 bacterium]